MKKTNVFKIYLIRYLGYAGYWVGLGCGLWVGLRALAVLYSVVLVVFCYNISSYVMGSGRQDPNC